MAQSAFIACVAEAEPFVAHWRERFDPPARLGVPAHITLLFPFAPPELITTGMLDDVKLLAESTAQFAFRFDTVKRFPGVVYLAPEPARDLVRLAAELARLFPAYPPYGGAHKDVVPHITVARGDEATLAHVERELVAALGDGSVAAACAAFVLIENSTGLWKTMHTFELGAG